MLPQIIAQSVAPLNGPGSKPTLGKVVSKNLNVTFPGGGNLTVITCAYLKSTFLGLVSVELLLLSTHSHDPS